MSRVSPPPESFDLEVETLVIGAGAGGLVAALAATERGEEVLVVEADAVPSGSTALSAGLIPAAGTRIQQAAGIEDSPEIFAGDIQNKAHGENDPRLVDSMARVSAQVIDWLSDTHHLPFSVVTDFDYPGHSRRRMHGLPTRSGRELVDALREAAERAGIDIICERRAVELFADGQEIRGVRVERPDGGSETIACQRLILACNGFGGNRDMVARLIPDIRDALWFGHDGNRGEAIEWGDELGAQTGHLASYQGHGNVAHPHGILITWAVIMEGGVQVNLNGDRFWNESQGYSEAARMVLSQPEGVAFAIFDERIAGIARQFADFQQAEAQGAIRRADDVSELAKVTGLPEDALSRSLSDIPTEGKDGFGRPWHGEKLQPPFAAVKVTGALFHTQGGLIVDPENARVLHRSGAPFNNLYAVGGAACGVSGEGDSGYLSGNGLLSAVTQGWLAGRAG
ncbi:MAG: FAD-dependent oxidoreductase [Thalassovita sp.]|nr:FAD-dependent oxidoreductase [Thalassovita sp.]